MMYKIMSTVKAHLNENKTIVSPTQTLLKDGILQTSNLMPRIIQNKILDADVVVDKNSIRPTNGTCRGDIYVQTKDNLSLLEQRQLIDGMSAISLNLQTPILSPVVIRNAPDVMPKPTPIDETYHIDYSNMMKNTDYVETDSAFIGAHVSIQFPTSNAIKHTYRNADSVARSLNKELNALGLKTSFTDMSVCRQIPNIQRECYMLFQKTSRFKESSFEDEKLSNAIQNGFCSDKLKEGKIKHISIVSPANTKGLIGSISLENVQMAGQRMHDLISLSDPKSATIYAFSMDKNPLYVNGLSMIGEKSLQSVSKNESKQKILFGSLIPSFDSSSGYQSSTPQDLSSKWDSANAWEVNLSGTTSSISDFHKLISYVKEDLNELGGYDEEEPFITDIVLGESVTIKNNVSQSVFLCYDPEAIPLSCDTVKSYVMRDLKKVINDYTELKDIDAIMHPLQPLCSELTTAKEKQMDNAKTVPKSYAPQIDMHETLKSDMLNPDAEDRESQMSL